MEDGNKRKKNRGEKLEKELGDKYPEGAKRGLDKFRGLVRKKKPEMPEVYGDPRSHAQTPAPESEAEILDVYAGPEYFGISDQGDPDAPSDLPSRAEPDPSEMLMVYAGPPAAWPNMMAVYAGPDYFANRKDNGIGFIQTSTDSSPERPAEMPELKEGQWFCPMCGALNSGKFCIECGNVRPAEDTP